MDADIKALENEVAKINAPYLPNPSNTGHERHVPRSYHGVHHSAAAQSSAAVAYHPYRVTQAAMVQAAAVRIQAHAAAINAARTRTLMSAAAQAQAEAARQSSNNANAHHHPQYHNHNHYAGPSYTKNNGHNKRYENDHHNNNNNQTAANDDVGKAPKKKKIMATHQNQLRTAANEKWVDESMTDWPENDFRIFCGDLGNEVSDAMLTSAFSKYPSFAKAKVVRDKRTGKSKGYGFVSFSEPNDFIRAFKEMNGKYVGNRPIKLRRSKWKERMKKVKNFKIKE